VSAGHSWKDIKTYSLSEAGVFIRAIVQQKNSSKSENLLMGWHANHNSHDNIVKISNKILNKKPSAQQIKNNIDKLKRLFGGG